MDRPILFSGPMVRAILNGTKTQTRRIVKPQPGGANRIPVIGRKNVVVNIRDPRAAEFGSPYQPGDRLWVRETWTDGHSYDGKRHFAYRATQEAHQDFKWKPSIHMPRTASRITLEITAVRVERLNDISEADAKAEGLKGLSKDGNLVKYGIPDRDGLPGNDDDGWHWQDWNRDPSMAFRRLWESINGPESWDANPWVWVVEFKRVEVPHG
jgi:hypothetical protein